MGGNKMTRRRNEEAARQKWKCFWCPVQMTPVPPYRHGATYPPTMVTLDHMFHKGDPRRDTIPKNGERRYVAACRRCNEERGAIFEALRHHPRRALQKPPQALPLDPAT